MSVEQWSDLLFSEAGPRDGHAYGSVRAVNEDGSYMVQLNASNTLTRCAPFCTAMVGDRVKVVINANGKCDAIGRLGGEIGGGGGSSEGNSWYVNPADYVVEWGTEGIWDYRKYASGIMECWTRDVSVTFTATGTQTREYYSFPFEFLGTPDVIASPSNTGSPTWLLWGGVFGIEALSATQFAICAVAESGGNYMPFKFDFAVKAIGRWKTLSEAGGTETIAPTIEDRFKEIEADIEELQQSGGTGGSCDCTGTGFFTLEVDEDGNLYAIYDDGEDPPSFELDSEGNLYYIIEE